MSDSRRADWASIAEVIPEAWRSFVTSGEYTGSRASIRVEGTDVPADFVARLEFLDERRLAIHVALAEDAIADGHVTHGNGPVRLLTARERAVIALIATGRETPQIAEALGVSPATVRTHVRNAMSKLGTRTRAQLVAVVIAGENGHRLADAA
ncbi:MAG TPA: helix-turn-helix transcriptional regulator [Solirubrobacteraceae bacterium]|jgi:DNA-binding NarL/FixJ family response regulator|nr:helix-turn-helix transcriptional regulator [Solirubrobacteraceae bacterium]